MTVVFQLQNFEHETQGIYSSLAKAKNQAESCGKADLISSPEGSVGAWGYYEIIRVTLDDPGNGECVWTTVDTFMETPVSARNKVEDTTKIV